MNMRSTLLGVALALATSLASLCASAQYPSKPIRLILPFPPGGAVDSAGRVFAQWLSQSLAQPVIPDNRPGADGAIAAEAVIKSPPDGYTLLFATNTAILAPPTFRARPPYDPVTAFTPIGLMAQATFFLFVHEKLPVRSLRELIDHARANPGRLNYAGQNSTAIMAMAQLTKTTGVDMQRVPYKGDGPAIPDLVAGRVQVMLSSTTSLLAHTKDGKLRMLAAMGEQRGTLAPAVPTFIESGYPQVSVEAFVGVFGPARLPDEIVKRLSREVNAMLQKPEFAEQLAKHGMTTERSTAPAPFARYVGEQLEAWKRAVKDAGIEPD